MKKKRRGSSARGARAVKNEKFTKSKKIDFSDIPELSDRQLSSMGRVGRPTMGDEPRKVVRKAGRYTSEDIHRAIFQKEIPASKKVEEFDKGVRRYMKKKHARR